MKKNSAVILMMAVFLVLGFATNAKADCATEIKEAWNQTAKLMAGKGNIMKAVEKMLEKAEALQKAGKEKRCIKKVRKARAKIDGA